MIRRVWRVHGDVGDGPRNVLGVADLDFSGSVKCDGLG